MAMAVERPEKQDWTYRDARSRMVRAGRARLRDAMWASPPSTTTATGSWSAAAAGVATGSAGRRTSTASCDAALTRESDALRRRGTASRAGQHAARTRSAGRSRESQPPVEWAGPAELMTAAQVPEGRAACSALVDSDGNSHLPAVHLGRHQQLDVHAGISEPAGRLRDRSRLVIALRRRP